MTRRSLFAVPSLAFAQIPAADQQRRWIEKAEALKPQLRESEQAPVALVRALPEPSHFLRWRMQPDGGPELRDRAFQAGSSVILDFGNHLTGRFAITVSAQGRGVDAPARVQFIFGEVPAEVAEPFDPYKGWLSRAWLQDEIVNIDLFPARVELPRRFSFRYAKIQVVGTSPNFSLRFEAPRIAAVTSAAGEVAPLPAGVPERFRRIDAVSVATLRECMQSVFEDGPKRDRRLWVGDLRLQALTNYATFRNYALVKRCLYLIAAFPRADGMVPACIFHEPAPSRGHEYIIDYAALFGATVLEYAQASGDRETARELWPVVRKQMEILGSYVSPDGLFRAPEKAWVFVDWNDKLHRLAPMHGIYVYAVRRAAELAEYVGDGGAATDYRSRIPLLMQAAHSAFFDSRRKLFASGPAKQVSWATQAWMALAGIVPRAEGAAALRLAAKMPDSVRPGGPYLYHYVVDAMLNCGMEAEALDLIGSYWGGMVDNGADTFWEVYDPSNPTLSPYGNFLTNSYCHAWSCTPSYFLRQRLRPQP